MGMASTLRSIGPGAGVVFLLTLLTWQIAAHPMVADLGISPLIVGIVLGMLVGNIFHTWLPASWHPGMVFCFKTLLRLAVVFYGFRVSLQQMVDVGLPGLWMSVLMLGSTLLVGLIVGIRILKMDKDTTILTSMGASICGAAAVLATESVLRAAPHKAAIAVATVVLFGTVSMFVYPFLYQQGWFGLDASGYGLLVGGTIHEVAQVVAASSGEAQAGEVGLIVKMTRVFMLAPVLLLLGAWVARGAIAKTSSKTAMVVPWFAIGFIGVVIFNSLNLLPSSTVSLIIEWDTFVLAMSMVALGMDTRFVKLKKMGWKPFILGLILWLWLLLGGLMILQWILS